MAQPVGYDEDRGSGPTRRVRGALRIALALALLGGIYLAAVRGAALQLDLAGLGRLLCL